MKLKYTILLVLIVLLCGGALFLVAQALWSETKLVSVSICPMPEQKTWKVQSIDTMKYSRDHARKRMLDTNFMQESIPRQVEAIAETGATHVAINTAYDDEFLPMLRRWVQVTRENDLSVLFRGNWSAWEGWFEYPKNLTRQEHVEKTRNFILENAELFEDGDIFSACPECENGVPGDPRHNGDLEGHRQFLIEQYEAEYSAFKEIGKDVAVNNFSMNGDVAELVMDQEMTDALGGVVTIDHYVDTPKQLVEGVNKIAKKSGGKIFIGEFGAPLGGIHGHMTEERQAEWLEEALELLRDNEYLEGLNYWVNMGGSTALWDNDGEPFLGVSKLSHYFKPRIFYGKVTNELGLPIEGARVYGEGYDKYTDEDGCFAVKRIEEDDMRLTDESMTVSIEGYRDQVVSNDENVEHHNIVLIKEDDSFIFKLQKMIKEWKEG